MQNSEIQERVNSLVDRSNNLKYRCNYVQEKLDRLKADKEALQYKLEVSKEGSIVVTKAIEDTHKSLETSITDIVNHAMQLVFQEPYELSFKLSQRGSASKTSQVVLSLKKAGVEIDKNLKKSVEGGMLTIISLVLRIAFLSLKPDMRKVLILDEPFGAIARKEDSRGSSALDRTFSLVERISKEFGVQMIIVTHTDVENR